MAKVGTAIDDDDRDFIRAQKMFFVATAPLAGSGHVNLSPKGLDTLTVLDPHTVAYLDLTGSGAETIAHLKENGRIVVMFCAFEGAPRILRLHGRGDVLEPGTPEWTALAERVPARAGGRAIVRVRVARVATSCGHGVPLYRFEGERTLMDDFAARKGEQGLRAYRADKNHYSLDGLPALDPK